MRNCRLPFLLLRSTLIALPALPLGTIASAQDQTRALSPRDSSIVKESDSKIFSIHGRREQYDSLTYNIIRRWYQNGHPMLVCVTDRETKITHQLEYYVSGQLREEGSMTAYTYIPIGTWNYYEPDGSLKASIDHDRDHPISYWKALEIARANGVTDVSADVSLVETNGRTFWQVVVWKSRNGRSHARGVNIDVQNGAVVSTSLVGVH